MELPPKRDGRLLPKQGPPFGYAAPMIISGHFLYHGIRESSVRGLPIFPEVTLERRGRESAAFAVLTADYRGSFRESISSGVRL